MTGVQLHDNSLSTFKTNTPALVDATNNWWGAASGPVSGAAIGNVNYTPWCTNAACTGTVPPQPSNFYGYLHFSDAAPSDGAAVNAYLPGVSGVAAGTTIILDPPITGSQVYQIDVPGDLDGTSGKEGGVDNDLITFMIGTRVVATGAWHSGTNVQLDFHPPQALPGGPYYGLTGASINLSGSANDWGTDASTYAWNLDGNPDYETPGQNISHSWSTVGTYTIGLQVTDAQGGVGTATTTVNIASITLGSLSQTYDGSLKSATATTDPTGLTVDFAYTPPAPTNVGSYAVVATITGYAGEVDGTLVIGQATSSVTVTCPPAPQTFTGSAITPCSASYSGAGGLSGLLTPTYSNNVIVGTATASATYAGDANHTGSSNSATFEISAATATITLGNLNPVYDGNPKSVTYTTTPPGLVVDVTYNGSATPPTAQGSYAIVATIHAGQNYTGTATATMYIQSTHGINLVPGWNLVSFNLHPMDTLTATVLNGIAGKYDLVYGWDATGGHSQQRQLVEVRSGWSCLCQFAYQHGRDHGLLDPCHRRSIRLP